MDFIKEFKNWIIKGKITDAPDVFLESVAYQILSSYCQRNLYVQWGHKKIYANLWILLIAKSSLYRKSTSIDLVRKFIPEEFILPNEYSSELLLKEISIKQKGIFLIDELLSTMRLWEKDYAISAKSNLVSLFDCETSIRRKTMSYVVEITNPYISIFAGSTPVWIKEAIKEEDLASGFLPRFLLVYYWGHKERNFPLPSEGDKKKLLQIEDFLKRLTEFLNKAKASSLLTGEKKMEFTTQAKREIQKYFTFIENLIVKEGNGLAPFYTRLLTYVIKLCILNFLSNDKNWNKKETSEMLGKPLSIHQKEVVRSIKFIEDIRKRTEKLLSSLAFSKYQVLRGKILELLEMRERISYSELLRKLKIKTRELKEILDTLNDEGSIEIMKDEENPRKSIIQLRKEVI